MRKGMTSLMRANLQGVTNACLHTSDVSNSRQDCADRDMCHLCSVMLLGHVCCALCVAL